MVSGFMSNRARQFVASYIIVELRVDWRVGAELFESFLVDYDVHANWGNWMRAAGVDGQGFGHSGSRWFNLAEERDRFDKHGLFVRFWLDELAKVPAHYIHAPWTMPPNEQERACCVIGRDYPLPLETPSKLALEGSADPAFLAPELYATTRAGKMRSSTGRSQGGRRVAGWKTSVHCQNEQSFVAQEPRQRRRWGQRKYDSEQKPEPS